MALGLVLGRSIPSSADGLDKVQVGSMSLPIAVGFLLMLGWFHLRVLPGWLGLAEVRAGFSITTIVVSVLVFLGVPLMAGCLTRTVGEARQGTAWYKGRFLPRIGPVALYGLLFTIVVLFAPQGHTITSRPFDVVRIALPLLVYFAVMFGGSSVLGRPGRPRLPSAWSRHWFG